MVRKYQFRKMQGNVYIFFKPFKYIKFKLVWVVDLDLDMKASVLVRPCQYIPHLK